MSFPGIFCDKGGREEHLGAAATMEWAASSDRPDDTSDGCACVECAAVAGDVRRVLEARSSNAKAISGGS